MLITNKTENVVTWSLCKSSIFCLHDTWGYYKS